MTTMSAVATRAAVFGLDVVGHIATAPRRRGQRLTASSRWTSAMSDALASLPPPPCGRAAFEAMSADRSTPKRHVIVQDEHGVAALISLRSRRRFWEPVAHQCIPDYVAPARDDAALATALASLGIDVRVESGLVDPHRLEPTETYSYPVHRLDLESDIEAYWRQRRWLTNVRKARKRSVDLDVVVDGDGHLEWTVRQWAATWRDDEAAETSAAADRIVLWKSLTADADISVHTIALVGDGEVAAGAVHLVRDRDVLAQCIARNTAFDDRLAGNRIIDASIGWAIDEGHAVYDLAGGGGYKRRWAPENGVRYGAIIRPWPHRSVARALRRAGTVRRRVEREVRSAVSNAHADSMASTG